jgi:hypothetical protein
MEETLVLIARGLCRAKGSIEGAFRAVDTENKGKITYEQFQEVLWEIPVRDVRQETIGVVDVVAPHHMQKTNRTSRSIASRCARSRSRPTSTTTASSTTSSLPPPSR